MDSEINSALEPYQVLIEPRIARYSRSLRLYYLRNRPLIHRTVGAILLNSACAAYQSIESHRVIYPGSKLAATILRTRHIERTWYAIYWILAIVGAYYNVLLLGEYTQVIRGRMPWAQWVVPGAGWLKHSLGAILGFLSWLVIYDLALGPLWLAFPIRLIWQTVAWNRACNGWDIDSIISGVTWASLNQTAPLAATAVLNMRGGDYTVPLYRNESNHFLYFLYIANSVNATPPVSYISYDTGRQFYTFNNLSSNYTTQPVTFPALELSVRDPLIPFINPNDDCYPPSLDLVYSNGSVTSNVLRTVMLKPGDCTTLKVCGMRDDRGLFEVGLGLVMKEQFRASVYCSLPQNGTAPPPL